jgi:tripartite-type tricarboxylate transporter receptor subunit TctC
MVQKNPILSSVLWLGIVALPFCANTAAAQDWPMRQPIRVIAPATAGSTVDVMARLIYEQVGRQLGQTVVVENRDGAGTTIGMAYVAKSPADGYTILVNSTSYAVVASTYAHLPYDPREDMTGIALLAHIPFVVASSPKYKTLAYLVAVGRQKPSPINFGTLGLGSAGHLATARLMLACNFGGTNVPFRGTTEALREVIAGRLDMYSGAFPNAQELAKSGQINLLAVMRPKRSTLFPGVPTTIEAGCPNSDYDYWMGSYLPAKTPRPIIERLNAEANKALQNPEIKAKLTLLGGETEPMSFDQFNAFIAQQRDLNAEIVSKIHYKPQ